ncbi:hypothetical protein Tco_1010349 [Tanacetum coccineum]
MVDSQPIEEEIRGAETRVVGTKTHRGPTEPVSQAQKPPSPSPAFITENIYVLRTMIKEHDQQAKIKATPKRLSYADSDKKAPAKSLARGFFDRFSLESSGTSDTHKQTRSASKSQRTPSKNKEPAHLRRSRRLEDRSITKEKARRERSKPRGKSFGHQETSSDFEYEEGSKDAYEGLNSPYKRPKPTAFTQIITRFKYHGGQSSLETSGFDEVSQKFLEEFSQQKRYAKDPTEIHGIKRRQNEGLQAFMDRFKSKSLHIKGVPLVLRILDFMHGHGHPELAKKLNDKIPKTVDEMFEKVEAFIRGEVVTGFCDYHGDRGHNTNDCYQLKEKIEEVVASGKLTHQVKDIRRNNQQSGSQGRNNVKVEGFLLTMGVRQRSCINIASKASMLTSGQDSEDVELRWNRNNGNQYRGSMGMQTPRKGARKGVLMAKGRDDQKGSTPLCANDMYPFPEEGEELASSMGYSYKCFLRLPKEHSQIRMAEDDEEKTGFHTEEGVYCFTHMPKELKNSEATLPRMM